nr:barstar family protein [Peterkaempfera griseoplana]
MRPHGFRCGRHTRLCTAADERGLHTVLAQALRFPSFYGMNRDAFRDAITGPVEIPAHLPFVAWDDLCHRLPHGAVVLRQAPEEYQHECRPEFLAEYVWSV